MTYRLVLVEWKDKYNTDSYYLDYFIDVPLFRKLKRATEWVRKHIKEIAEQVDKDYTTDLYVEQWDKDFIEWSYLYKNLHTKGEN